MPWFLKVSRAAGITMPWFLMSSPDRLAPHFTQTREHPPLRAYQRFSHVLWVLAGIAVLHALLRGLTKRLQTCVCGSRHTTPRL
eukprot:4655129-Prymnesium_polylepis.1